MNIWTESCVMKKVSAFLAAVLLMLSCSERDEPSVPGPDFPQNGQKHFIEVLLRSTGKKAASVDMDFSGCSEVFLVKSDVWWNVSVSEPWMSVEVGDNGIQVELMLEVNLSGNDRAGHIVFTSHDGDLSECVNVVQAGTSLVGKADFSDMMLVMNDHSENIWSGYLSCFCDGKREWLFDAFCLSMSRFDGVLVGSADSKVTKTEYEYAIKEYLGPDKWLDRLDRCISASRSYIDGGYEPRKVFIAIPHTNCEEWGDIEGKMMNTKDCREDNVTVACWFVDRMLNAYAAECVKGKYSNLRLAGFYWQQENGNILPFYGRPIAGHIHGKNLDFLWIPYFNAYNWSQWAEYGFDKAWLQPNWLFNDRWQDRSHLYDACSMAAGASMGVEVEWDSTKDWQRHVDYWDVYEELGILDSHALAYYDSGSMIACLDNLSAGKWRTFYERVASDIARRHKRFYGYANPE